MPMNLARSAPGLLVAVLFAGCAPTTMSPAILRTGAGDPTRVRTTLGMQTGPRLSAPYSGTSGLPFMGDANSFAIPQFSFAYDLDFEKAITREFSAHFGAQGEFYYPLPLPGYGLYGGMSYRQGWGSFSIAPALSLSGATDFGIGFLGGPGTIAGLEVSTHLAYQTEDGVLLGVAPFAGVHRVFATGADQPSFFTGFVLVLHLERPTGAVQAVGGFGRVFTPDQPSWNVPIAGFRGGR